MNEMQRAQLDELLDGELPEMEREAVRALLETDRTAVEYLAKRAALMLDLRRSFKRRRLQKDTMARLGEPGRKETAERTSSLARWPAVATAAALVVVITLSAVLNRRSGNQVRTIADHGPIMEVIATQQAEPAQNWKVGARLPLHRIELTSGRVAVRLPGGESLDLAGPLEADFVTANELRLSHGNVTATVAMDHGSGFVVQTEYCCVVDRGRSFAVGVDTSNEANIVAIDGNVEVSDAAAGSGMQTTMCTLAEGEAVRIDASKKVHRLRMVSLGFDGRTVGGSPVSHLVADVTDNVSFKDFRRYYGIIPGGMDEEDTRIYTTGHNRTWHAMPGVSFPKELEGADAICTFSADRHEENLEITLSLKEPCQLYIMADAREPAPSWLSNSFVDTGLRLRSGPWLARADLSESQTNIPDDAYIEHAIWRLQVVQPGPVVLGPPRSPGYRGPLVMYGIAVKEIP